MSSVIRYFVIFSVCVILTGCAPQASQSKVAVIELNKALTDSGYGVKIDSVIKIESAKFNQRLGGIQNQMLQAFNKKKTEFGEKPTDEQTNELRALQNQIGQQLRLARNSANQELGRLTNILVTEFRSKLLSPNVEKIAKDKGFDIVMLQTPDMIAFNKTVNITDSVVEAIKAGEEIELKLPEIPNNRPPTPNGNAATPGANPLMNPSAPVKKPADKKEDDKKETESKDEKKADKKEDKKESKPEEKAETKETTKKDESSKPEVKKEDSEKPKESAKKEAKATETKSEDKK